MTADSKPDRNTGSPTGIHVFTYGSLMFQDIFAGVTSTTPVHTPARLPGWSRHGLLDRAYPGALPSPGGHDCIDGVLWLHVPPLALEALDRFEGQEYERVVASVLDSANTPYPAWVYQWLSPDLIRGFWCVDTFERDHRRQFLSRHWQAP